MGGNAELYLEPRSIDELVAVKSFAKEKNLDLFILGGGSNVLISSKGINGIVCSMVNFKKVQVKKNILEAEAGAIVSDVCQTAFEHQLKGFEFIYAMPGTLGGAIWMNARCYGGEISQILREVDYLDETGRLQTLEFDATNWKYKVSPFQNKDWTIIKARFSLQQISNEKELTLIKQTMDDHEQDRRAKGHFDFPCAGSLFKNNRDFGAPSGKIIDSLNLRGMMIGDASISEKHGNIFINKGKAKPEDMRLLIKEVKHRVYEAYGFDLEEEVLSLGDWT
jgi:UDP-N-acetylmuramate dehydrogenase